MSNPLPGFSTYWNQVTPGNAGKWESVEFTQGSYNWTALDAAYDYAIANSFRFKHHTLVWGSQQPSWITSLDSASQRAKVEQWIHLVGDRYPSMSFIDVVNEPFHAPPPYMNALGGSGATGWDWVVTAFTWARQYCLPGVKLILNEYNVIQDNSVTTNYLRLIDTLRVRGLIDGIGVQGHYFEFKSPQGGTPVYSYPIATLKANLNRLTATGLPVYISEFDINEAVDSTQLQNYKTYFPLFWENPGVKGMTLWGYLQTDVWKPNAYLVRSNGTERPALLWLRTYFAQPVAVSPIGTTNEPRDARLIWRRPTGALSYHLQVATDSAFTSLVVDSTVTDTLVQLSPLAANTSFFWHVNATIAAGTSPYSATAGFSTGTQIVSVGETREVAGSFMLYQNYPNPFNPETRIRYVVPEQGYVTLRVYNLLGAEVATLFAGVRQAGTYVATFDATGLASGVYICRLSEGRATETRKLIHLK